MNLEGDSILFVNLFTDNVTQKHSSFQVLEYRLKFMAANAPYHLLVIDDDSLIIDSLKLVLPKHWKMTAVQDASLLDAKIMCHAAFVDMHLKGNLKDPEGPAIIERLAKTNSQIEIIAMSGDQSLSLMESCLKNGAKKFLAKPLMSDEILSTL